MRARHRWRCLAIWVHNTAVRRVARFAWHAASVAAHQAAQRQFKASVEQWRARVEAMREQYEELLLAAEEAHKTAYVVRALTISSTCGRWGEMPVAQGNANELYS